MSRGRGKTTPAPDSTPDVAADPENTPAHHAVIAQREESWFSGPLPAPQILREYDAVLPGAAERILRMAEKDQADFHEMGMLATQAMVADRKRGQIIGGIVALTTLAVAAFLGYAGHEIAASTVGGTTVVGLVTVFVTGRRSSGS